ncbi:MAG: Hpt domain-containing protein [Gammaproteobacteria bacterium]|nr:Hpt domain-containing protein [Gammaproteobacteria bacterium]
MASGGGIDIKALNWVKTEIGEALNQIRQALETYVETPDPAKLDFIAAHLHQITGTLHIVELFGPALLAEEMEHLAQALKAEQVKQKQDAYEVLTRGILQLPAYLEHLSHGHQDRPVLLLALLNDLRAARGLPLLSENALFTPDLNVLPPPKTAPVGTADVRTLTKKLRSAYQAALVGVLRGNDIPAQTKKLAMVLAQLDGASHSATVRQLWWVARGVVEALAERGLDTSVAVKMLLGQLDRKLKTMVEQGEAALQKTPSKDLVKNLLFYVAQATSKGARVSELKTAFKLDQLLPSAGALSQSQDELLGVNAGVMDHVAAALKEDLLSIKETVDLFVRTKDRPLSELEPVIVKLRTVADTLGMLGLGRLRQPVTEQEHALKNVLDGTQALTDDVIMGVAGALLFVESSLGDLHTVTSGGAAETTGIASNALLPEAEYRSLVGLTTQEARAVLARVKDAVLQFAAQPTAFELLQPSAESINDIKGAMLILGYEQAADLMGLAGQFLVTELLEKRSELSARKLDTLADVIAGLEYFLESASDDPVGARNGLNTVRESLALLGYGAMPAPEVKAPEPDITVIPSSDPVAAAAQPEPIHAITAAAPVDEPPPVDPEVLEIFLEEAGEECVNVATQLELWKKNAADDNALRTLRRSFHTVKGSGRIVGAMEIGEFAWAVENMLNRVLDRTIEVSPAVYGVLEQARDLMPLLVEELRAGSKGGVVTHPLIERAQRVAKGELLDDLAPLPLPVPELVEAVEDVILGAENALPPARHVDPVLAEIFVNETRNHLAAVSAFIEHCAAPDVHCTVNEDLIRALHTLHGSARMANIEEIADVADALEKWAKLVAENHSPADTEVLATLRSGYEFINDVLRDLSDTHSTHPAKLRLLEHIAEAHRIAAERQQERLQTEPVASLEADRVETAPDVKPDDDVDVELVNVFLLEATDLVGRSMGEANVWVEVPQRDEYIDEIRRRFSTLHGGARIANLIPIATACSAANALLAQLQENPALRSAEAVRLILRVLAWVDEALTYTRDQRPLITPSELLDQLENYSTHVPSPVVMQSAVDLSTIDPDAELRGVFLDEAVDILQSLDEVMGRWRPALNDLATLGEVQRGLHTIKGGANMARIEPVGELCHQVETLLQRIGEGLFPANSAAFDAVQAAHDWLARSVESLRQGESVARPDDLLRQIDAVTAPPQESVAVAEPETEPLFEIKTQPEARPDERQVIPFPRAAEPVLSEATDGDSDLLDVFLEEANEILAAMDDLITRWAADTTDAEVVGELQRALHTIKGGARMAKVAPIGDLSHSIENIFEGIAQGRVKTNSALVDVMHTAYDWAKHGYPPRIRLVLRH